MDEFLDYEVKKVVPISELVAPPNPDLEDEDDYEDVPGIITTEQAAAIIDSITELSDVAAEDVTFDETLIPTGGLPPLDPEVAATMS